MTRASSLGVKRQQREADTHYRILPTSRMLVTVHLLPIRFPDAMITQAQGHLQISRFIFLVAKEVVVRIYNEKKGGMVVLSLSLP